MFKDSPLASGKLQPDRYGPVLPEVKRDVAFCEGSIPASTYHVHLKDSYEQSVPRDMNSQQVKA